jgi:hypothetical protein
LADSTQLEIVFLSPENKELESLARELRRLAGLDGDQVVLAPRIVEGVLGVPVRVAPTLSTAACLAHENGRFEILIREVTPDTNFDIAHELGHYALKEIGRYVGPEEERYANQIAAILLAPQEVVRHACRAYGRSLRVIAPLAQTVRISQTAAHFRLGEVLQDARVVLTQRHGNVLVRSVGKTVDWTQVPIAEVARGKTKWKGIVRAELRGGIDEGRVALRAR